MSRELTPKQQLSVKLHKTTVCIEVICADHLRRHPKRRIVREEPVERKDRMRVNRVRRVDMVAHALLSSSVQWAAVIFAARRAAAPTAILVSSPLAGRRR